MLHAGSFLGQAGDLVIGTYLAAHVQRLGEQHGGARHVTGIGAEGVHDILSGPIDHRSHGGEHAVEGRSGLLQIGIGQLLQCGGVGQHLGQLRVLGQDGLHLRVLHQSLKLGRAGQGCQPLLKVGRPLLHPLSDGTGQVGAHVGEAILLFVIEQRHLARRALIGAHGRYLGQIVCQCRLALPVGRLLLEAAHLQCLVVLDGQRATTVQAQRLPSGCHDATEQHREKNQKMSHLYPYILFRGAKLRCFGEIARPYGIQLLSYL